MRFLRRSLTGIFLLSLTLVLLAWAGSIVGGAVSARMGAEPVSYPQRERAFTVNVTTLTPQTITPVLQVFGDLRSQRRLDLRAATGGTVLTTHPALIEGGVVRAGDVLLTIDPANAQAALARARADLADAQAELRDAQRGLELARDERAAAQVQADLRAAALLRARELAGRGVGSAAAVETAELAASAADAAVLARRQAIASAQARIDQAVSRIARSDIDLAAAARDLDDTTLTAAFDGIIGAVTITPGGRIAANEMIAQLVDPARIEVAFRVSTAQYARLLDPRGQLGAATVTVSLDAAGVDLRAAGRISREGAVVTDGQTGRLLFAQIDDPAGLRPGDFVTVSVAEPALENAALLPATAVGADDSVLVVGDDDRLQLRPVLVLRRQGDNVIVAATPLADARIVIERAPLLGAGIKVRPLGGETPADAGLITLDPDRRARLIAFVAAGTLSADEKARITAELALDRVPAATVARIERRMGS